MNRNLNISKTIITVIILNIIQITAIAVVAAYNYLIPNTGSTSGFTNISALLFISAVIVLVNSYVAIQNKHYMTDTDHRYKVVKDTLSQVENLNKTLRVQRHDFMNHLQVVYSLIEMEEYSDAKDYIDKVYTDIQKVNRILKTSNTAVNALLQAKFFDSEKRGIIPELIVTTRLEDLGVPSWELCRVFGNLIDNAIDALEEKDGNKLLKIKISEDLKNYIFTVEDNGPAISPSLLKRIFEPGFTTKGDNGEGMGLYITKDILQRYGGDIKVESSESLTSFEAWVPKA